MDVKLPTRKKERKKWEEREGEGYCFTDFLPDPRNRQLIWCGPIVCVDNRRAWHGNVAMQEDCHTIDYDYVLTTARNVVLHYSHNNNMYH